MCQSLAWLDGRAAEASLLRVLSSLRRHPYLTMAFVLATAAALVFLINVLSRVIYWQMHENEPIEAWMTVGYIDRSWNLEPGKLDQTAHLLKPRPDHPLTLTDMARIKDVPVSDLIADVEAALVELKARPASGGSPGESLEAP